MVTLSGTPMQGDTWTIAVAGFSATHKVLAPGELLTAIAADLASQLAAHFGTGTAAPAAASVLIDLPGSQLFHVGFSLIGTTPRGTATIVGDPYLSVSGPAFTSTVVVGSDTLSLDTADSTHAYAGGAANTLVFTLSGTPTVGDIWQLTLNGVDFGYGVKQGDGLGDVATKLADIITKGGVFKATADATAKTITLTPPNTNPFTAFATGAGTFTATTFHLDATAWATLVYHLALPANTVIEPDRAWAISLNTGASACSAVNYTYIAGQHGESALLAPMDARVADARRRASSSSSRPAGQSVIEPSPFVVFGDGFVTSLLQNCGLNVTCFKGDFGTSEVGESQFHATLGSAQDLEAASWGLNANPEIANAETIPHVTIHGTGDGNSDFYRFVVSDDMLTKNGGSIRPCSTWITGTRTATRSSG